MTTALATLQLLPLRTMAGIAGHLLEFPPEGLLSEAQYHNRALNFIESLHKLDSQKIVKADAQQDLLQVLNPAVNSIAFLYILTLRHRNFFQSRPQSTNDARTLLSQALNFLHQFDPIQLRYAGSYLRQLINDTLELAHNLQVVCSAACELFHCFIELIAS
jgi:COP9 signalosome complex subunit 3